MKSSFDFKIGDAVFHHRFGDGIITAYSNFEDEIYVKFEEVPTGWSKELCVSPYDLYLKEGDVV